MKIEKKKTSTLGCAPHEASGGCSARSVTYHVRELDVGETVDQGLAQVGEFVQEGLVLLLDHFVLLLDGLQAALHGGDLKRTDARDM